MKTAEQLRDEYTFIKPCWVDGETDPHTVWFKVGSQSFPLNDFWSKEEAEWMRLMLGKAFEKMIAESGVKP